MQENSKHSGAGGAAEPVIVYATFPTREVAESAAHRLVSGGLAACVNILPGVTSVYRWQGQVETASEAVAIIKTTRAQGDSVTAAIAGIHPYDVPAIVVVPLAGGLDKYLSWIISETQPGP